MCSDVGSIITQIISDKANEYANAYVFCELTYEDNGFGIPDLFGGVYGFSVEIENKKTQKEIFNALKMEGVVSLSSPKEWLNFEGSNEYPLYWGSSTAPHDRLRQHISGPKGNGCIRLNEIDMLKKYRVNYGMAFCGYDYKRIEENLIDEYPPLLKTRKKS